MKKLSAVAVFLAGCCLCGRAQNGGVSIGLGSGGEVTMGSFGETGPIDTIREVSITSGWGASSDSVPRRLDWHKAFTYKQPFPAASFVLPAAFIAYGAVAVHNHSLQHINGSMKEEIWEDNPHQPFHLDNYLQFAPIVAVYALNAAGVQGKNNFRDRTIILLMANAISNGTVFSVKKWAHELRPDGSDYLSFPSGHTTEAFASAEFMRMEYKDVSPLYGLAGYAMATATGMLRMYNNKHWMSDVVAGAGVGIASTRLAYWLYPKVKQLLWKDKPEGAVLVPTYQNGSLGLSFAYQFK